MNTKVRNLNEVVRQIHQRSVLPIELLDVAEQMVRSFPEDASSDGIHFDRPRGVEWLNDVFQRHISTLEADLLETAQFTFGRPPNPPFLASRDLSSRLGARVDSRDSAAQEHMNEGLEVLIPTESTSSLRGLETQPISPLMDAALSGYTPSSTPSGSQVSGSSSRLKELNERLQLRNRESPARVELPPTWREQPVRSVVIASYKKNTEGRYHRHSRMDWSAAPRAS